MPPVAAPPLADWHAERIAQAKPRKTAAPEVVSPTAKKPVGRPRRAPTPKPVATQSARRNGREARGGARFTVEFEVQTVLRAADVREALRRVRALGAIEVLAITQEN